MSGQGANTKPDDYVAICIGYAARAAIAAIPISLVITLVGTGRDLECNRAYFPRGATFTKVRLQSPSLQPGGSSPAMTYAFRGEPGFVANTAKL